MTRLIYIFTLYMFPMFPLSRDARFFPPMRLKSSFVFSADFFSVALQREYGVCEEVRTPVQLAGQREEAESSPVIHKLPQQMEPASLLSATVHIS